MKVDQKHSNNPLNSIRYSSKKNYGEGKIIEDSDILHTPDGLARRGACFIGQYTKQRKTSKQQCLDQ
jgi:hypothetical protein